jgi:hypothetical protein
MKELPTIIKRKGNEVDAPTMPLIEAINIQASY